MIKGLCTMCAAKLKDIKYGFSTAIIYHQDVHKYNYNCITIKIGFVVTF